MDVLHKIALAFESYAAVALAMQMAGEKAETAAKLYQDLAEECKFLELPHEHYQMLSLAFKDIAINSNNMNFDEMVKTCLNTAAVCR